MLSTEEGCLAYTEEVMPSMVYLFCYIKQGKERWGIFSSRKIFTECVHDLDKGVQSPITILALQRVIQIAC